MFRSTPEHGFSTWITCKVHNTGARPQRHGLLLVSLARKFVKFSIFGDQEWENDPFERIDI